MRILAIDTSGLVAGAAVWEDGTITGSYTIQHKKTHSQTMLPMIDEMLRMLELSPQDLDAVAVAKGPGSFTGLRIGSATAKGLGLALGIPVIGVPTVDALACVLWGSSGLVCPLMNARREQVYTGLYRFDENGKMETLLDQSVCKMDEILGELNRRGEAVTFLGDGVPVYRGIIEEQCRVSYRIAPAHRAAQGADAVAVLGAALYQEGKAQDAAAFRPEYLRLSQAERERRMAVRLVVTGGQKRDADAYTAALSERMAQLSKASFGPEAWNAPAFSDALCAPYSLAVLAFPADEDGAQPPAESLAGFALYSCAADEAELLLVAVDEAARRHGVADQMLSRAETEAAARGIRRLFLEVRESNEAARALYERFSFEAAGRRPRFYAEPEEDALIYRKEL